MRKLTDNSIMPYGKYKGRIMIGVPADYLLWLYDNERCSESVARYIEEHRVNIEHRRDVEAERLKRMGSSRMPFGSYRGVEVSRVPAEYLMVMYESGRCPDNIREYVEHNIEKLQERADKDRQCRNALRAMYK